MKHSTYLCIFITYVSKRPTRGEMVPLAIPRFDTKTLHKSFHISASYLWNSLPSTLCEVTSFNSFKIKLHGHLFGLEAP